MSKENLKIEFESGKKITQEKMHDLIDESVNALTYMDVLDNDVIIVEDDTFAPRLTLDNMEAGTYKLKGVFLFGAADWRTAVSAHMPKARFQLSNIAEGSMFRLEATLSLEGGFDTTATLNHRAARTNAQIEGEWSSDTFGTGSPCVVHCTAIMTSAGDGSISLEHAAADSWGTSGILAGSYLKATKL